MGKKGGSFMGFISNVFLVLFCILWTLLLGYMGAPAVLLIFGAVCVVGCSISAVHSFYEACGKPLPCEGLWRGRRK